jgi:Zn-dependent M16 (insulinase) family peptidase
MVDWNGLYKWSMEYQDGTAPSNFKAMSKDDRQWLEEAMKQYTFNDSDRLTELINQLKAWSALSSTHAASGNQAASMWPSGYPTDEAVVELLEELTDLAELHARNNLNLCLMGGMTELLSLIYSHESGVVRKQSCHLLTSIMSNNRQVQEFASKSGAINLVTQFQKESTLPLKDAIFGSMAAWLKADNFEGKRRFIND